MGAYCNNAFNYKQIIDKILEPLRKTGNIDKDILCLNLDTGKYENNSHYQIDAEAIIIVEGVLLLTDDC